MLCTRAKRTHSQTIMQKVSEGWNTNPVTCMKAKATTVKKMASAGTYGRMDILTLVCGRMEYLMDKEDSSKLMGRYTMEHSIKESIKFDNISDNIFSKFYYFI